MEYENFVFCILYYIEYTLHTTHSIRKTVIDFMPKANVLNTINDKIHNICVCVCIGGNVEIDATNV